MTFNLISLIIVMILSGALVFGWIVPKYNSVLEIRQKLSQSESEFSDYQSLVVKSEEFLTKLEELSQDVEKINFALPFKKDESFALASIEQLVSKSGLVLEDVDMKVIAEKTQQRVVSEQLQKKYKTLTINLKLSGDYNSIKSFVGALEKNMPIMKIVSLDIHHEKGSILSYDLVIETYYLLN